MANGSLYSMIHNPSAQMTAQMKVNILKGVAFGMLHLTLEGVVHRDLAARNILVRTQFISYLYLSICPQLSTINLSSVCIFIYPTLVGRELGTKDQVQFITSFPPSIDIHLSFAYTYTYVLYGCCSDFGLSRILSDRNEDNRTQSNTGPIKWMRYLFCWISVDLELVL